MTYFIGFGNVFCKVLKCYMDISYDPTLQVLIEHVPSSAMSYNFLCQFVFFKPGFKYW